MPRAKKKPPEDNEYIHNKAMEYFDFVIEQLSGLKTPDEKKEYIKKHKVTARIIEKDGQAYFTIFKKTKLIDQNHLLLFRNRELDIKNN